MARTKKICHLLKLETVNTNKNAGGHIHIGAPILGSNLDAWRNFLYTWGAYEHILFRFFYGDKVNGRKGISRFAKPIAGDILLHKNAIQECQELYDLLLECPNGRNALNFNNVKKREIENRLGKNTIEFRCPNATVEEVIWQNNINTSCKLLLSCNNHSFDKEFVWYKLSNMNKQKHEIFYNEICIQEALEFADLIFNNNLDKLYFLRQYFKDFKTYHNKEVTVFSKKFWR